MSAVIPLDELLILSSLDDRKLYLLSPEAVADLGGGKGGANAPPFGG